MKASLGTLIGALIFTAEARAVQSRSSDDVCHVAIESNPSEGENPLLHKHAVPISSETGTGSLPYNGPPLVMSAHMLDCEPNVWCVLHNRNDRLPPSRPFSLSHPFREIAFEVSKIQCYTCGDLSELEDDFMVVVSVVLANGGKETFRMSIAPESTMMAATPLRARLNIATAVVKKGPRDAYCHFYALDSNPHVRSEDFSIRKPLYPPFSDAAYLHCYR